jgi:hypothetical protein
LDTTFLLDLEKKMNKQLMIAMAILLACILSTPVHAGPTATQYELELFDSPLPTHPVFPELPWTDFTDISDDGIVVWQGYTLNPSFEEVYAAGIYDVNNDEWVKFGEINFDTGVESGFFPFGINNSGAMVTGDDCGYVNKKGEWVQLVHPLYAGCETRGIANNGKITGFTRDGGIWRGFVYDPQTESFEDFLPSADRTLAQEINSKGQVVGGHEPDGTRDGFLRESDGTTRFFKVNIDGVRYDTRARGIAEDGTIVGAYTTGTGKFAGFVGRLSDDPDDDDLIPAAVFDPDDITECNAFIFLTRINSKGVITGICWADDGSTFGTNKGLLLTPVPQSE